MENLHGYLQPSSSCRGSILDSSREVYFVDTDSYQIEDFPCPVGIINYTAPEIQGKHFPECYEQGKKIKYSLSCVDCGEVFQITNSQYDYFMEKGFDLPKRCPSCRAEKRKRMEEEDFLPGGQSDDDSGSICFIATAVCRYYGEPDDCRELTLLWVYRDTWLKNRPGGPEAIAEYYQKAPLLVSLLQASEQYGEICERLWTGYIRPCAGLIEGAMSEEGMLPGPGRPFPADTNGTRPEKTMRDGTGSASGTRTEAILNGTGDTGGTRTEAILDGTGDTGGTRTEAIIRIRRIQEANIMNREGETG